MTAEEGEIEENGGEGSEKRNHCVAQIVGVGFATRFRHGDDSKGQFCSCCLENLAQLFYIFQLRMTS